MLHEIEGTIVPAYGRAHSIGLGASVGLDGWVISADVGAKFHQDNLDGSRRSTIKNPEIRSVLQVDHPFAIGQQQLFATAGVIHRAGAVRRGCLGSPTTARSWSRSSARCTTASCSSTSRPTWYLISRLQTSFLREQLSVEDDRRVGHQRGGPPPDAAGELRNHRHLVGGRRRKPVVHARRPRQHQNGPATPGRRQGQRVHPDHAPLLTPPRPTSNRLPTRVVRPSAWSSVSFELSCPRRRTGKSVVLPTVEFATVIQELIHERLGPAKARRHPRKVSNGSHLIGVTLDFGDRDLGRL